jgi:hypothetical protein
MRCMVARVDVLQDCAMRNSGMGGVWWWLQVLVMLLQCGAC